MRLQVTTTDGRWHAGDPHQHVVSRKVFRNLARVRVFFARVYRRRENGSWLKQSCPHNHWKLGAARKCGEALARRLNREDGL